MIFFCSCINETKSEIIDNKIICKKCKTISNNLLKLPISFNIMDIIEKKIKEEKEEIKIPLCEFSCCKNINSIALYQCLNKKCKKLMCEKANNEHKDHSNHIDIIKINIPLGLKLKYKLINEIILCKQHNEEIIGYCTNNDCIIKNNNLICSKCTIFYHHGHKLEF